jgi:integrase
VTKGNREREVPYDERFKKYLDIIPINGLYLLGRNVNGIYTHHTHESFYHIYYKFFDELNEKLRKEGKTEVPRLTPHKCRHTFASLRAAASLDTVAIQRIIGHADYSTTANIYTHINTNQLKKEIEKIEIPDAGDG